jgi:hypothetical protein
LQILGILNVREQKEKESVLTVLLWGAKSESRLVCAIDEPIKKIKVRNKVHFIKEA